jgi:hypothetical protein
MFGEWTRDVSSLAARFNEGKPFKHVVIPDFFDTEVAHAVHASFPEATHPGWHTYRNPIEIKQSFNAFDRFPVLHSVFARLDSPEFVNSIKEITGIRGLEPDPHMHGAGIHRHGPGGKLGVHIDYCIHPVSGKQRRVNVIVYVTPGWREEWRGFLELWQGIETPTECLAKITPTFNTAVIFETTDESWHGMPEPVRCPEGTARCSLAAYYVSDPLPGAKPRSKACFKPVGPVSDRELKLYDIRSTRILTPDDLWDGWET